MIKEIVAYQKNMRTKCNLDFIPNFGQLFCVLLFLSFTSASAVDDSCSQTRLISIKAQNTNIDAIFKEIERTTPYRLVYHVGNIDLERKISVNAENEEIDTLLKQVFKNTDTTYVIEQNQIILKKINRKTRELRKVQTPTSELTGTILDTSGRPLFLVRTF